jgi:hypothetical protein
MAIRFPEPPQAIAAAARDLPGGEGRVFGLRPLDELGGATPPSAQPVFTAGLDAIVAGEGDVESVVNAPTSWRYASELGGAPRAYELVTDRGAAQARATSVGDDRFTTAIRDALVGAQADPRVNAGDFEARLLRVPALKLLAVWLHAADTDDLFMPVVPTAVDATPGRLYDAGDFRSRLREAASRTLALYDQAERPDELGGLAGEGRSSTWTGALLGRGPRRPPPREAAPGRRWDADVCFSAHARLSRKPG